MKIIVLLVLNTLLAVFAKGQASCPTYSNNKLTDLGDCNWQLTFDWNNPTSGNKSFRLQVLGSTIDTCIDASTDGTYVSPIFNVPTCVVPTVSIMSHTGNKNCLGAVCGDVVILSLFNSNTVRPRVTPLPYANGIIYFKASRSWKYAIIDMTRKVVATGRYRAGLNEINISHLPRGMYVFETEFQNYKIIK